MFDSPTHSRLTHLEGSLAKPLKSKEEIIDAAISLLRLNGAVAFNIRDLAAELRCSSRTIYQQVGKRDELLREVVRHYFSQLELEFKEHPHWKDSAISWSNALRALLLSQPHLARLFSPQDRPAVVDYVDQLIKCFLKHGLEKRAAARIVRVLVHNVIAMSLVEVHASSVDVDLRYFEEAQEAFDLSLRWMLDGCEKHLE